jgi:hypothetical protein
MNPRYKQQWNNLLTRMENKTMVLLGAVIGLLSTYTRIFYHCQVRPIVVSLFVT